MEFVLFIVALASCIYLVFIIFEYIFGFHKIINLSHQPSITEKSYLPSLSIILSALNEERDIENTLLTLNNLNYPDFEIIAINDRSSDKTPEILDRLQAQYSRLKVLHIKELPKGWLGKNHALHVGAQQAKGDWLLFTDADVSMHHDVLNKSISYVLEHKFDHLTIYEKHSSQQFWLKILLLGLYMSYSMIKKPWRISYAWSKKSLGHGAFNLVNKQAYQQCGGHAAIAMECLDDVMLGSLLKSKGFRQDIVDGRDYIQREWYSSLQEMINGLKKNSFAYYNYQVLPAIRDALLLLLFCIWPFIAVIFFDGTLCLINAINIGLTLFSSIYVAKHFRLPMRYAVFYPFSMLMLIYTVFNSVFSTISNKGIIWRGTYYPLEMIKNRKFNSL